MLRYEIDINGDTIYTVKIVRKEKLTKINKFNIYTYILFNDKKEKCVGQVKHKYIDGMFVLINKVNNDIISQIKNDSETKHRIEYTFNSIKNNQGD